MRSMNSPFGSEMIWPHDTLRMTHDTFEFVFDTWRLAFGKSFGIWQIVIHLAFALNRSKACSFQLGDA